jgi:hypothetical protein
MAERTARCRSLGASGTRASTPPQAAEPTKNGWISWSNECHRLMYAKVQLDEKAALLLHLSFAQSNTHEREVKKRENEPQDTVFMRTLGQKRRRFRRRMAEKSESQKRKRINCALCSP